MFCLSKLSLKNWQTVSTLSRLRFSSKPKLDKPLEAAASPAEISQNEVQPSKAKQSERYRQFQERLRSEAPLTCLPDHVPHPAHEEEPLEPWPNNTNPFTGEIGGPAGPEPTRYGDWERKGRVTDF